MDDASLDEFLSDGSEEADAESEAGHDAERDENSGKSETDVEPAVATSRWHAEDSTCDGCGDGVSRLWNDDGTFVCRDCKDW